MLAWPYAGLGRIALKVNHRGVRRAMSPELLQPHRLGGELRAAWRLFTVLPWPFGARGPIPDDDDDSDGLSADGGRARAGADTRLGLWAYPVAGAAIGLIAAFVYLVASQFALPPLAAATLTVALLALITGAMHEAGLAAFAEGLTGRSQEQRLEIMRDPSTGAYGATALIMSALMRVTALASLAAPAPAMAALIATAALSRGILPVIVYALDPARSGAPGLPPAAPDEMNIGEAPANDVAVNDVDGGEVGAALGIAALLALVLLPPVAALLAILTAVAAALAACLVAGRLLGGHTGGVLRAAQQACEVVLLLVLAALLGR